MLSAHISGNENAIPDFKTGPEIMTQLKTWLNIEPSQGCPYSCIYCFRHDDDNDDVFDNTVPTPLASFDYIMGALEQHP
ncbi:MAG: hypothetical protein U9P44_01270, partial [archaeon]|nr:hypothetical protein [archaeon]